MKYIRLFLTIWLLAVTFTFSQSAKPAVKTTAPTSGPGYHLLNSYPLGGEGGWDYLTADSANRRLYISRGNRAIVVDLDTFKVLGEVPAGQGVHGIAVAPEVNKGYISNGRDNTVTVFDLKTLKPVGTPIATGQNPDAIVYNDVTKQILTMNGRSGDVTVINTKDDTVAGTVKIGDKAKLEFAANDKEGNVYINVEDKNTLAKIDPKKLILLNNWPLEGCDEPSGLSVDTAKKRNPRVISVCGGSNTMVITDGVTGKQIAKVPIGKGTDAAGFDPKTGWAFSSNGEGNVTVVKEEAGDKYSVAEQFDTQPRARTMTYDTKTQNVITVTAKFGAAPAPTPENPRPRPQMEKDSFVVLVYGPKK